MIHGLSGKKHNPQPDKELIREGDKGRKILMNSRGTQLLYNWAVSVASWKRPVKHAPFPLSAFTVRVCLELFLAMGMLNVLLVWALSGVCAPPPTPQRPFSLCPTKLLRIATLCLQPSSTEVRSGLIRVHWVLIIAMLFPRPRAQTFPVCSL